MSIFKLYDRTKNRPFIKKITKRVDLHLFSSSREKESQSTLFENIRSTKVGTSFEGSCPIFPFKKCDCSYETSPYRGHPSFVSYDWHVGPPF